MRSITAHSANDLINLGNYMTKMLFMLFSIAVFGIYVCWVPQINAECQSKTKLPCFQIHSLYLFCSVNVFFYIHTFFSFWFYFFRFVTEYFNQMLYSILKRKEKKIFKDIRNPYHSILNDCKYCL